MRLWLASGSPRRRALLAWAGWDLDVHPPHVDERRLSGDDPIEHALRLARTKVATAPPDRLALAADTVVHVDDEVFDKPVDRAQAARHLAALSGRWHLVTTGVASRLGDRVHAVAVSTRVRFRVLSEREIAAYLATGEADDKAGAYGIQGHGGALVHRVEGSWTNVMGLPLQEALDALDRVRP